MPLIFPNTNVYQMYHNIMH